MSRLLLALVLVLALCGSAFGQTWHTADQKTVGWDAVTQNTDGQPLIEGSTVTYTLYLANAITDPEKTNPSEIAAGVENLQHVITLGVQGRFFVGIRAVLWVDEEAVSQSTIAWSDDTEVVQDVPFGLQFFAPPAGVRGLRVVQ